MTEKILILDFGSQYTQLIARRIRELNTYCEIVPYNKAPALDEGTKAIILSGSPFSVKEANALKLELDSLVGQRPVLAICYGAQLIADYYGGTVERSEKREYGKAQLSRIYQNGSFLKGVSLHSQVWMSHADTVTKIPRILNCLPARIPSK